MRFIRRLFVLFLLLSFFLSQVPMARAQESTAGRIVSLAGEVNVISDGVIATARPFQDLKIGDVVMTGKNSRAAIILKDESLVKLGSDSKVTIEDVISRITPVSTKQEQTKLKQEAGEMWIRTKDRPGELQIDTKSGSAAIRGTEFVISATEGSTLLTVLDGQAELFNNLGSLLVAENEQGEATPTGAPTKRALTVEETENAVQWIFYFPQNLKLEEEVLDTSLETLTQNYEANPNDANAVLILGIKKLISGNYSEALDLCDRSVELNPNSATAHLMRGRALFALHLQKDALEAVEKAINADSSWYLPYADKSKYLASQGDLILAEKEAKKAVELGKNFPESWISLGEVQYSFGRIKEARESFERAINLDSNLAEAHIGRAKTLISDFDKEAAIEGFLAGVALEPGYSRAHLYLGQAYYQIGNTDKAIREIQEAINLDPKDPLALNSLSIIYDVAHRYGDALELDTKTIGITPNLLESGARQSRNLAQASGNLGVQPLRFGLTDWAFFQANKALRENPIDGASHITLGAIFNSNDVEPIIPKATDGAAQSQLSTGQIRGLRNTNLSGLNARSSTNEFDEGFNFAADSESTLGRLLTPSIIGAPNGRYRFFRAKEVYVNTDGFIGYQQATFPREGRFAVNGYFGTPWNAYLSGEFMGGLVRNIFGDLIGKGNRSFAKADFAVSPFKSLDVIGSYTRADVNLRVFDENFSMSRSVFTPEINIFDIALNWHPTPNNVVLSRFYSEITSTRLNSLTPELGNSMIFAGIFPRNYAYQTRAFSNHNKHRFTFGGEWVHSNSPSRVTTDFLSMGIDPPVRTLGFLQGRSEYDTIALYTQDLVRVTKNTDVILGFRYDQIFQRTRGEGLTQTITDGMSMSVVAIDRRDTDRISISPQTGVVYNIGENTVIRLAAQHKAFYNTQFPELAPQDVAGIPFSDQDEYFTRGTEGWEYSGSLEHKVPFANAFFRIKPFYRRMLRRDFDDTTFQRQKIRNFGFKVSYNQVLWKQVGVFFTYIYQHLRDRTKSPLLDEVTDSFVIANGNIPVLQVPNRFRTGITWHSPAGFSFNYINTYIGPRFGDLANSGVRKMTGYLVGDLNISYESPRTRSYQVTFGVNNLYATAFRQSLRARDVGLTFFGNVELRGVIPLSWKFWQ